MGVLQVIPENIRIHIHILQQATSQNPEGEGGGGGVWTGMLKVLGGVMQFRIPNPWGVQL